MVLSYRLMHFMPRKTKLQFQPRLLRSFELLNLSEALRPLNA